MKCFAVFVFVALAAVAMAQEQEGERIISNLPADIREGNPTEAPESEQVKRDKRGYVTTYHSAPYFYSSGYNGYHGYNAHYSTPYTYYRSYPTYGYGYRSHYYY